MYTCISDIVKSVFTASELSIEGGKDFVPHLTVAKMSQSASGRKKKKKNSKRGNYLRGIDRSAYVELLEMEFGSQRIEGLELLSMTLPPAEDGYYHCFERYSFDTSTSSS